MTTTTEWRKWNAMHTKPITNADHIRSMPDDEIGEWYWWMLHYVQGYTDPRATLREWLKEEYKKELWDSFF